MCGPAHLALALMILTVKVPTGRSFELICAPEDYLYQGTPAGGLRSEWVCGLQSCRC
jgi:hypothetical protein